MRSPLRRLVELYAAAYRGLPRDIWLLSAVLLINRAGTMVLVFLPLYVTDGLGYSLGFSGWLLAIYGVGHLVGAWLGGWLCDALGALRIQFFSLASSGLAYIAMESLHGPWTLGVAAFVVAVTAESFRPANGTALTALAPPELRTRAWALNRMALNLGAAIGPAVGGFLAERDWALLFWVDGLTCLAASVLLLVLFRGRIGTLRFEGDDDSTTAPAGQHPLRDRGFLVYLMAIVLFGAVFRQSWSTMPVDLKWRYGIDESGFGLLAMLNAVLILVFEMVLTHRAEGWRPLRVVAGGSMVVGAGLGMLAFGGVDGAAIGSAVALAVASMVVLTFGEMLAIPFASGWVSNRAGVAYRGKYLGLNVMAWGVSLIVGPAAGAWVYERFGPEVLWALVALVSVVAAGLLLGLDRSTDPDGPRPTRRATK